MPMNYDELTSRLATQGQDLPTTLDIDTFLGRAGRGVDESFKKEADLMQKIRRRAQEIAEKKRQEQTQHTYGMMKQKAMLEGQRDTSVELAERREEFESGQLVKKQKFEAAESERQRDLDWRRARLNYSAAVARLAVSTKADKKAIADIGREEDKALINISTDVEKKKAAIWGESKEKVGEGWYQGSPGQTFEDAYGPEAAMSAFETELSGLVATAAKDARTGAKTADEARRWLEESAISAAKEAGVDWESIQLVETGPTPDKVWRRPKGLSGIPGGLLGLRGHRWETDTKPGETVDSNVAKLMKWAGPYIDQKATEGSQARKYHSAVLGQAVWTPSDVRNEFERFSRLCISEGVSVSWWPKYCEENGIPNSIDPAEYKTD